MSKPKHYRRGKGRYIGYGYSTTDLVRRKGAFDYWANLNNEIEELKHKGPSARLAKLRRYLKMVKPKSLS